MNLLDKSKRPLIVGVGGFTSEVGKTTLLCDLLRSFPGWEAIKTTRGHYRSCGKDPQTCCVSHLLEDEAVVRSGRALTYVAGKDTGEYWDAGATNVHWVIATDGQVQAGINTALDRVTAKGVFVEGNSFSKFIDPDYFVMVARPRVTTIKATARQSLARVSSFYVSGNATVADKALLSEFLSQHEVLKRADHCRVFVSGEIDRLVDEIHQLDSLKCRDTGANSPAQNRIIGVPF